MAVDVNIGFLDDDGDEDENENLPTEESQDEFQLSDQPKPKRRRGRPRKTPDPNLEKLSDAAKKLADKAQTANPSPPPPPEPSPSEVTGGGEATGPAFVPPKKKTKAELAEEKLAKEAERAAQREQKLEQRAFKAQQAEDLRKARREAQDQARADRINIKDSLAASKETTTQIRSDAVSKRVQTYAASSILGMPGYVAASVFDQLLFRKQEEAGIEKQKQFQEEIRKYQQDVEQDRINKLRAKEDAIRNRPINAQIKDEGPNGPFVGPPRPPEQGPPEEPPRVPPSPPEPDPENKSLAALSTVVPAVVAGVLASQYINRMLESTINNIGGIAQGATSQSAIAGSRQIAKGAKPLIDPLGSNIPTTVVVAGFDQLLTINEGILSQITQDIAFSPRALTANVEGNIAKLLQRIELAQRLDPVAAELIKANTNFDMAWAEFRASVIETFGPAIVKALNHAVQVLGLLSHSGEIVIKTLEIVHPGVVQILRMLGIIDDSINKKDSISTENLMQKIDDFLNPATYTNPGP